MISQQLADARSCLKRLDATQDEQTDTLQVVPTFSKAVYVDLYVLTSKCIIREEVE